ncbi:MAG: hypothetical protein P4L50_12150 [Anaerolineaceae bacterium]|nr:hypothetical protein [Anaerolineaceae bacterium]
MFAMHSAKPYFYDFNSGAKTELKFPGVVGSADFFVSPDGKWLAYNINPNSATNSFMLDVEPTSSISTGNNAKPIKWEQNRYFGIEGWLDNNQLVINRKLTLTSFYSTLILNPFTGQKHEYFLEDYPGYMDFATSSTAPTYYESGNVIPDPTLSRLVYPKFVNGEDFDVLWDIGSKASLAQLRDLLPIKADPLWSPDGSDFVIPAATRYTTGLDHQIFDWFSVTKDGQVRRLTHFGDFLSKNYIISETRSPDGRYLAFQMNYQGGLEHGVKFFVLDLQHQNLGAFCVNSLDISGGEPKPVWSPDSKYVLLSNSDENDDENIGGLILADVAAKQAYEIAKGIHAVGWLAK